MKKRVVYGVFYDDRKSAYNYAWFLMQEGKPGVLLERINGEYQVTAIQTIH